MTASKAEVVGYGRVSSTDQNLDVQRDQLKAAGCTKLFLEKKSGASTDGRVALGEAIEFAREGDTFIVTRLDRLARSTADLLKIIERLTEKGVTFRCSEQADVNTSGAMGKLLITVLSAFAEFELNIRKERQMDGIAKAKAEGVYKGRPATIETDKVRALKDDGLGATAIAKRLKIGRASVYRVLETSMAQE